MISDYVNKLSKENKLTYVAVLLACIWFFNTVFTPDINFIVGIAAAIFIVYYDTDRRENTTEDLNTGLHYKLVSLLKEEGQQAPTYFHLEPDMINFFYDIRDFRIYNRDSYIKAIKSTDSLLKIKQELENDYRYIQEQGLSGWQNFGDVPKAKIQSNIKNHKSMFEAAEITGQRAINYIHSFVIVLPGGIMREKHTKAHTKFHILIKRILDDILRSCKKFSSDPLIGQDYGLPKPSKNKNLNDVFDFVYM